MNLNPEGIGYLVNLTGYDSKPFEVVSLIKKLIIDDLTNKETGIQLVANRYSLPLPTGLSPHLHFVYT
jgi:hypothetical protein